MKCNTNNIKPIKEQTNKSKTLRIMSNYTLKELQFKLPLMLPHLTYKGVCVEVVRPNGRIVVIQF